MITRAEPASAARWAAVERAEANDCWFAVVGGTIHSPRTRSPSVSVAASSFEEQTNCSPKDSPADISGRGARRRAQLFNIGLELFDAGLHNQRRSIT